MKSLLVYSFFFFLCLAPPPRSLSVVRAEFGDFAGPVDECPLVTTCPKSCVETLADCPVQSCPLDGTTLCADGVCRDDCSEEYENPCECGIACPRMVEVYEECPEATILDCGSSVKRDINFSEIALLFFMVAWITAVTAAIVLYCRSNRNLVEDDKTNSGAVVIHAFAPSSVGSYIYYATMTTICGIQFILLMLVILYYIEQGTLTRFQAVTWKDEERILAAFQVVWMVGFLWCLMISWKKNLRAMFWRRCGFQEAHYVAMWTPNEKAHGHVHSDRYVTELRRLVSLFHHRLHNILCKIYSQDPTYRNGTWTFCPVETEADGSKYFCHNFRRHVLQNDQFVPAQWQNDTTTLQGFVKAKNGLSNEEVAHRLQVVGPNVIEMRKPSFKAILKNEFTRTYYVYQNFIMWSWMPLFYFYMALVQSLVIVTGGIVVCVFRYRNECSLYRFSHMEGTVSVLRDGSWVKISPQDLVPGDVVQVQTGPAYCDMVLVHEDILVDESALTGESNPIPKTAVDPNDDAEYNHQKRHTIQAGTTVVETDDQALAVVTQTGSFTTKGELLRNIFSFQRHQFKFDVEVPIVLMILFVYTIIAFSIVVATLSYSTQYAWFYGMYVVAACLPPLLPTAFTVSVGVSDNRLKKYHNVACTNSEDIIIAGKVKLAFFDKTGTLTKQGLEFIEARSVQTWDDPTKESRSPEIAMGMAACHSLVVSKTGADLIGNPVDRTMFEASGARLQRDKTIADRNGNKLDILRHFDFDHHRMTLSTIIRTQDGRLLALVKGSGENVSRICLSNTLPKDFHQTLRASAKAGVYQISMAMKELPSGKNVTEISRDEIEKDLNFIGVINFRNVMRDETPGVIQELEGGDVRCVMLTGDSVLTGISIAKEAYMVLPGREVLLGDLDSNGKLVWHDEDDVEVSLPDSLVNSNIDLAVTGRLWSNLLQSDRETAAYLADSIRAFGRCSPTDKVSVVTHFVDRGFTTLMCGDGGNDCGALKTAHVGIALSDAEASIVSPFTSLDKSITSVVAVLQEGRCALASALANYRYILMYGQLTVMAHYYESYFRITFSEWCWIFIDGFWVIGLGFTLPLAKPANKLAPTRPTSSLLGPSTMASAIGVLLINEIFTFVAIAFLRSRDWYQCRQWAGDDISNVLVIGDNYEAQTLFIMMAYQLIATAMTYNFGYEWRASWWRNSWFVGLVLLFTCLHVFVILVPGTISCLFRMNCTNDYVLPSIATWEPFPIQNHWNSTVMPVGYRFAMLFFIGLNTVAVMCWDYYAVNGTRKMIAKKKQWEKQKNFAPPKAIPKESSPV